MQKKINKEELADGKSVMDTLKEMLSDVRSQISSSPFVNLFNVGGGGVQPQKTQNYLETPFWVFWVFWVLIGYF